MRPSHFVLSGFVLLMMAITAAANLGYARDFLGGWTAVPIGVGDKLGHAALFGILALLANLASPRRISWRATLAVVIVASLDEASQHFFAHRSCELADLVASLAGVAIGSAIAARIARRGLPSSAPADGLPAVSTKR